MCTNEVKEIIEQKVLEAIILNDYYSKFEDWELEVHGYNKKEVKTNFNGRT